MSEKSSSESITPSGPPAVQVLLALFVPPALGLVVALAAGGSAQQLLTAPFLGAIALASWFLGLRRFGLPGLGLRGRRPLFAGIGFAVLGWVVVLLLRFIFVSSVQITEGGLGRIFIYLLLFEAFAVQLWTFGLLFRALADWRGPLAAVFGSGALFALIGYFLFDEATLAAAFPLEGFIFFLTWGFFYGLIRLRTGSLLGMVPVQAMQSLTAWHLLLPAPGPDLRWFYTLSTGLFLILIWRLWPSRESDYRV